MTVNELIVNYIPLANSLAYKKFKKINNFKKFHYDELQAAAYFGLVDAANKFNQKGLFSTYAYYRINGEIDDYLRSLNFFGRSKKNLKLVNIQDTCI